MTRCDNRDCPARAWHRVDFWAAAVAQLPLIGKLFFCGHHYHRHEPALTGRLLTGTATVTTLTR